MKENSPIRKGKDFALREAKRSVLPSAIAIVAFNAGVQQASINLDHNYLHDIIQGAHEQLARKFLLNTSLIIFVSVFGINAVVNGLIKPAIKKAVYSYYSKEAAKIEALKK